MKNFQGKRVLITGGGRGIGLAIARRFAREGAAIVLTDVDAAVLDSGAEALRRDGAAVTTHVLDVTDAAAIEAVRDRVHAEGGPIDVLVNNAGIVFGGRFTDVPLERHLLTYRINVLGVVAMTRAFLPDLIGRDEAHLVNIASASGLIGLPYGSTYASSKWAVIGFSESIRLEMKIEGHAHVGVTAVCPSYVATGLFEGARPPKTTRMLTPDRIAELTFRAVAHNRPFVRTPWLVKITPLLKGALPTPVSDFLSNLFGATGSMKAWKGRG